MRANRTAPSASHLSRASVKTAIALRRGRFASLCCWSQKDVEFWNCPATGLVHDASYAALVDASKELEPILLEIIENQRRALLLIDWFSAILSLAEAILTQRRIPCHHVIFGNQDVGFPLPPCI